MIPEPASSYLSTEPEVILCITKYGPKPKIILSSAHRFQMSFLSTPIFFCAFVSQKDLIYLVYCLGFLTTLGDVWGLFLVLHTGISPDWARGTLWGVGSQSWVRYLQGKNPTDCTIPPAPYFEQVFSRILE